MVDEDVQKTFSDGVSSWFQDLPECTADVQEHLQLFKIAVISAVGRKCGQKRPAVAKDGKKCHPW